MHKKYQLYDLYELYGEVASCDTLEEIKQEAKQCIRDTDGECDLIIRQWDERLQAYRPVHELKICERR